LRMAVPFRRGGVVVPPHGPADFFSCRCREGGVRRRGLRQQIREARAGVEAAVWLFAVRWPAERERSGEEILGFLHAGVEAGEIEKEGAAVVLRQLVRAGWRFSEGVGGRELDEWAQEVVDRIGRGEESVS